MSDILIGNKMAWKKSNDFINILNYLGGEEPSEQEIWGEAREYKEPPYFVNVWYSQVLMKIKSLLVYEFGIDENIIECYVNSIDTHLYIDGEEIYGKDCIIEFIEFQKKRRN